MHFQCRKDMKIYDQRTQSFTLILKMTVVIFFLDLSPFAVKLGSFSH